MDELRDPQTVRLGHISKKINNKKYVVRVKPDGTHYWDEAKKEDIACSRFLQRKIKKLMKEAGRKTSRVQSKEQALAIAYSMTSEKFPSCGLTVQGPPTKKRSSMAATKNNAPAANKPKKATRKNTVSNTSEEAPKKKKATKKKSLLDTIKGML